jgi:hypothetical protein
MIQRSEIGRVLVYSCWAFLSFVHFRRVGQLWRAGSRWASAYGVWCIFRLETSIFV